MTRILLTLGFAACVLSWLGTAAVAAGSEQEELAALRGRIESYVTAFNNRDADQLAEHWTDRAEYLHPLSQQQIRGQEAIGKAFAEFFQVKQKLRLRVEVGSLRLVANGVAIEDSVATIAEPEIPPETARYTAVHVKQGDQWHRASVREVVLPPTPAAPEALQELAWMVGDWRGEGENTQAHLRCNWTGGGRFLFRSFVIRAGDKGNVAGTQIIGHDPSSGQIRSWTFDSDGGFSEGVWSREKDRWIVKATAVMPDGGTGSEQRVITRDGEDRFAWRSVQRQVNGGILPGSKEITVVRVTK
jgi:uncharacterized protein (TIGR02246 family)